MATYAWKRYNILVSYEMKLFNKQKVSTSYYSTERFYKINEFVIERDGFRIKDKYKYTHKKSNVSYSDYFGYFAFPKNNNSESFEFIRDYEEFDRLFYTRVGKLVDLERYYSSHGHQEILLYVVEVYDSFEVINKGSYIDQVISNSPNTYPSNGISGNYYYEFIGKISDTKIKSSIMSDILKTNIVYGGGVLRMKLLLRLNLTENSIISKFSNISYSLIKKEVC